MNFKYCKGCDQFGWDGCWKYIEDSFQIVFIRESRKQFPPFITFCDVHSFKRLISLTCQCKG